MNRDVMNSLSVTVLRNLASQVEAIENGYLSAIHVPLRQCAKAIIEFRDGTYKGSDDDLLEMIADTITQWRKFDEDKDKQPNRKSKGMK